MEGGEEVKFYCLEGGSFSFFCLLAPLDSASDPLGLCLTKKLSSVICFWLRIKMFLKWHMALSLKMFMLRLATATHPDRPARSQSVAVPTTLPGPHADIVQYNIFFLLYMGTP